MITRRHPNIWREPPIVFQILALLLGGLVVAQLATLLLTLVLPPAPPAQHDLHDIVEALNGRLTDDRLDRLVQSAPPDTGGPGWFTSDQSRHALATMLGAADRDVRLSFYAPLPFAGITNPPPPPDRNMQAISWQVSPEPLRSSMARLVPAMLILADQPGPRHGGGGPGGGFPGGFPGGAPTTGGFPDSRFPGNGFPAGNPRNGAPSGGRPSSGSDAFGQNRTLGDRPASPADLDRQPMAPAERAPEPNISPRDRGAVDGPSPVSPGLSQRPIPTEGFDPGRFYPDMNRTERPPVAQPVPAPSRQPVEAPAVEQAERPLAKAPAESPAPPNSAAPQQTIVTASKPASDKRAEREPRPLPITPKASALFGLAPAPFVEGDFVAAKRLPDGRWAVVQPAAEGFPNAWQRRVILWFVIAFAVVAPFGWLFARHIVRPLARFTDAAEALGRDPSAALVALEGPAEIGRAAHAFNVMQNRLRSFVDDRTAMVGAISHDLRTPLTRLRFRIEEVEEDAIRDGMNDEVAEMEAMITSVLAFIRDASTPNVRERLDLSILVEDVVQDAALVGGDVVIEHVEAATVEVDVLGMRRLLANLVENAVKYGDRARIRLMIEDEAAVADIRDDGPGVPEEELERAFEPFYRATNATSSGKNGTGLGLAVCRSIARAHGGDVLLVRSAEGFSAQLRLPLAYNADRIAA